CDSPEALPRRRAVRRAQHECSDEGHRRRQDGRVRHHRWLRGWDRVLHAVLPDQIPNLAALARKFVISDRTFSQDSVPSWGGHLNLAAATLDGFDGNNPGGGPGWGCDSGGTANWRATPTSPWMTVKSCVPDQQGHGAAGATTPVQWVPTIMDHLDSAGRTWNLYVSPKSATGHTWSICPTFADCLYTSQATHMKAPSTIVTDAQGGNLPNFAIVTPSGPTGATSQHNQASMFKGDNWIGQMVQAIESGPQWSSTAIFITYDDCGCFYDHVSPAAGLGIRLPMVIVSPYAKAGTTDHNVASTASMLAYAEHVLGVQPLNERDGSAYDYSGSFDYTQTVTPAVPMQQSVLPAASQQYLATHPSTAADDDT
ncbi:MAG: hypothetical protein JO155_01335, partial [Acidimicrobiia bacterium]|nr:hypothetical protein [Acidimicrobiia bacterium]